MESLSINDFGIVAVIGVILLLVVIAAYQYHHQRRRIASGRQIGYYVAERTTEQFRVDGSVYISSAGKWSRLLLKIKSSESFEYVSSIMTPVEIATGVPFVLVIRDASGRVLYKDKGSLGTFIAWLAGQEKTSSSLFHESGDGSHQGTITLLEFMPPEAGQYEISLQLDAFRKTKAAASASCWDLKDAELTVMEDVVPLSKTIEYPHKRVQL